MTQSVALSIRPTLLTNSFAFAEKNVIAKSGNSIGIVQLKNVEIRKPELVLGKTSGVENLKAFFVLGEG